MRLPTAIESTVSVPSADSSQGFKRFRIRSLPFQRGKDSLIFSALLLCACVSLCITAGIVIVLCLETLVFFSHPEVSVREFFTDTQWQPAAAKSPRFGVWPLLSGTFLVTVIAMSLAIPLGVLTALYLSEYAPRSVRVVLKPMLEILAGLPTIVLGFLALRVLTPGLVAGHATLLNWTNMKGFDAYNALSAGIAVGILCFPTVCSLAEEALRAVPRSLREGAYALGSTPYEAARRVVIPAAKSGIVSAIILATARAISETMIVALAAGSIARMTVDPRDEVQTITGHLISIATDRVPYESAQFHSLYAIALVLFCVTLTITLIGSTIRRRFRESLG